MSYKSSNRNWEGLAQKDALWSILTDGKKKGDKWDKDVFFHSGETEVNTIMSHLKEHGLSPVDRDSALDFGCGVGRISRALSAHFNKVVGIDVSATMIQLASTEHKGFPADINFLLNESDDLHQLESNIFSMVFSVISLQHIPVNQSLGFIQEFIRLIKPGGLAVFQIPTEDLRKRGVVSRLRSFIKLKERLALIGIGKGFAMHMNQVDESQIQNLVENSGARIIHAVNTNQTEPAYNGKVEFLDEGQPACGYISKLFVVTKN